MQSAIMQSVIMQSVITQSVIMLSVIMQSLIMWKISELFEWKSWAPEKPLESKNISEQAISIFTPVNNTLNTAKHAIQVIIVNLREFLKILKA